QRSSELLKGCGITYFAAEPPSIVLLVFGVLHSPETAERRTNFDRRRVPFVVNDELYDEIGRPGSRPGAAIHAHRRRRADRVDLELRAFLATDLFNWRCIVCG